MTLIRVDGFDDNLDTSKWTQRDAIGTTGAFGRRGTRGLRIAGASTGFWNMALNAAEEHSLLCIGFAYRQSSFANSLTILELRSDNGVTNHLGLHIASTQLWISLPSGSQLNILNTTLVVNTWYYIELYANLGDTGVGYVRVGVNGVYASQVSADTKNVGTKTVFDTVRLMRGFPGNSFTVNSDYDDLYVRRNSTDFLGDVEVNTYFPTAQGASAEWNPSNGVGPNYTLVDEAVVDTADYAYSDALGAKDSYKFSGLPTGRLVHGVAARSFAKKATGSSPDARPFVRVGGVDTPYPVMGLTTVPELKTRMLATQPNGSAWDSSSVEAADFGVEVVAVGTPDP